MSCMYYSVELEVICQWLAISSYLTINLIYWYKTIIIFVFNIQNIRKMILTHLKKI